MFDISMVRSVLIIVQVMSVTDCGSEPFNIRLGWSKIVSVIHIISYKGAKDCF